MAEGRKAVLTHVPDQGAGGLAPHQHGHAQAGGPAGAPDGRPALAYLQHGDLVLQNLTLHHAVQREEPRAPPQARPRGEELEKLPRWLEDRWLLRLRRSASFGLARPGLSQQQRAEHQVGEGHQRRCQVGASWVPTPPHHGSGSEGGHDDAQASCRIHPAQCHGVGLSLAQVAEAGVGHGCPAQRAEGVAEDTLHEQHRDAGPRGRQQLQGQGHCGRQQHQRLPAHPVRQGPDGGAEQQVGEGQQEGPAADLHRDSGAVATESFQQELSAGLHGQEAGAQRAKLVPHDQV
mmetsp:Transcript_89089/g.260389  ORF Transcript_89089/g.260389 Transcript_89089/m.260389 type:complete len:290 (-) Transcript_89089:105-974(-)